MTDVALIAAFTLIATGTGHLEGGIAGHWHPLICEESRNYTTEELKQLPEIEFMRLVLGGRYDYPQTELKKGLKYECNVAGFEKVRFVRTRME